MCYFHLQRMMRGMLFMMFLALLFPAVSALFTVEVEQRSYEAKLHGDIELVCRFSKAKSPSDLIVIWQRIEPEPVVEVYRYERGTENHNYTSAVFRDRAQLIREHLNQSRAVLRLRKLRIKDSGIYQCIVREGYDVDYKRITLNVTAPNIPIKKTVTKTEQTEDEVKLSCEFQGYPLPQVIWSDGQNIDLTGKSSSIRHSTEEDLINFVSTLTVKRDLVRNYTCSFLSKGGIRQNSTFIIPDEIPPSSSHQYVWIVAVVMVILAFVFIFIILQRRKHGQKGRRNESSKFSFLFPQTPTNTDSLMTINENRPQTCDKSGEHAEKLHTLRDALTLQYSQPDTETKNRLLSYCNNVLPHVLQIRGDQTPNISSIMPEKKQIILLMGKPGSGKTTVAQILSSCWAQSLSTDPFNVRELQVLVLVDCGGAEGDFFQLVTSNILGKTPKDVSDVKEMLLGPVDCLVILDGYREGNRNLDETLWMFLKERQACRILVMSCPGECPALENRVKTVLNLIPKESET